MPQNMSESHSIRRLRLFRKENSMKYILNRSTLKCLLEIKMCQKDISVQFGLECISSNFLFQTHKISALTKSRYSVGLQRFGISSIPQHTVELRRVRLESIGPPVWVSHATHTYEWEVTIHIYICIYVYIYIRASAQLLLACLPCILCIVNYVWVWVCVFVYIYIYVIIQTFFLFNIMNTDVLIFTIVYYPTWELLVLNAQQNKALRT